MLQASAQAISDWQRKRKDKSAQRQLLVISGDADWTYTLLRTCQQAFEGYLDCSTKTFKSVLGNEFPGLIYRAFEGFRPSELLAYEGCIADTGLFVLITPPLESWSHHECIQKNIAYSHQQVPTYSNFVQYFIAQIKAEPLVAFVNKTQCKLPIALADREYSVPKHGLTQQQATLVEQCVSRIKQQASVHFIEGERGRGKSFTLNALVDKLSDAYELAISAPTRAQCKLISASTSLFIAPDQIMSSTADILIIDEVSALSPAIIQAALAKFSSVIMAGTVLGYEGSGLGLWTKILSHSKRKVYRYTLEEPIRWRPSDALEKLFNDTLLNPVTLDLSPPIDATQISSKLEYIAINRADLAANLDMLKQAFMLLRTAHYQTTPDDFMRMMDAPEQQLWVVLQGHRVLAAAVCIEEKLDIQDALAIQISHNKRRVQGNLVLQTLANMLVSRMPLQLKNLRINRIAVEPKYQRQKLGTKLIKHLEQNAKQSHYDLLSVAFGATTELLSFWQDLDFIWVKYGLRVDTSSGLRSAIMLRPISTKGIRLCQHARNYFNLSIPYLQTKLTDSSILPKVCHDMLNLKSFAPIIKSLVSGYININDCLALLYFMALTNSQGELLEDIALWEQKGLSKETRERIATRIIAHVMT